VAALTEALPVSPIPEQFAITFVRCDVFHIHGRLNNAQLIAVFADRVAAQVNQPHRFLFGTYQMRLHPFLCVFQVC
jgi:hypothetical protein